MRVVVIGGDATGMSAASQVKRSLGEDVTVTVLQEQRWTSYSACGIPYWVGGVVSGPDGLVARTPAEHRRRGIDVRTGMRATAIDRETRTVTAVPTAGGPPELFEYDQLVLATGAAPRRPPVPGLDLPGVYAVQTLDDAQAAIDGLGHRPRTAVILGAGYIGVEMAEAALRRGLATTVIDRADQPVITLDPDMGAGVADIMRGAGVDLRLGAPVTEIRAGADGRVADVRTATGVVPADIVFLGLGVTPRTELAAAAGLPLSPEGALLTDDHQRVRGHDDIWAGGDCVVVRDRLTGADRYLPLATHANKQGRIIGLNLAGVAATFPGAVGTAILQFRDTEIARTGLGRAEAEAAGRDVVCSMIASDTRVGYMPGATGMTVKLLAERGTGLVLGAQIVGGAGAGKRIDVVATALWAGLTVGDLVDLDLAYAPPVSPVWDPVQTAARVLLSQVARSAG